MRSVLGKKIKEEEGDSQEGRDSQRVRLGLEDPLHWVGYGLTRILTKHAHLGDSQGTSETSLCQCPHSLQTKVWGEP